MSSRCRRARGALLVEAVMAFGFAILVIGLAVQEIARQRLELAVAREEARARSALRSTNDRLRAGDLAAPPAGAPTAVEGQTGLSITLERASGALDPRLANGGKLVAVLVRARWRAFDGKPCMRELTAIVPDPARGAR